MKKRVLVFCGIYFPSNGGGGGTWAVANMVDRLSDRFEFYIVTGIRHRPESPQKLTGVRENSWNDVGKARVYFVEPAQLTASHIRSRFADVRPDVVFLNSIFSAQTIKYLRARKRRAIPDVATVIAPCGELLPGALASKTLKKRLFLAFAKGARLYAGLVWRASFESESASIRANFGPEPKIGIASDLTPRTILPDFETALKPQKTAGSVKLIFLSRLARNKNLRFLLERLCGVTEGLVELEIIGPPEDKRYWAECLTVIRRLPANVVVTPLGEMTNAEALKRLTSAHFFVFPTLGENFGYVFIEALAAGCPLLISDRTDWGQVASADAGWIIPLETPNKWTERIIECVRQPQAEYRKMSESARRFAIEWLGNPEMEDATVQLFDFAVQTYADRLEK